MDWGEIAAFFSLDQIGGKLVYLAVAACIAYAIQKVLARVLGRIFDAADIPAASIFVNIVKAFIWALALLAVLEPVFGIQPTAFVAALGVTSVVISLGLQDTVSNVIGGLALMMGQVVKPGDRITVNGLTGVVTDVTWRNTLVRDAAGSVQVIPNSVLNKTTVIINSEWQSTVCKVPVILRPDVDIDEATADMLERGRAALGDWMAPGIEPAICLTSQTAYGIEGEAVFHVLADKNFSVAKDRIVRSILGAPYLAEVELVPGASQGRTTAE